MNTNLPTSGVWSATVTLRKLTARRLCFLCNWKLSVLCNLDNCWPYFSRSSLNQDQDKFVQELCRWGWKHYNNIALKIELDSSNFLHMWKNGLSFRESPFCGELALRLGHISDDTVCVCVCVFFFVFFLCLVFFLIRIFGWQVGTADVINLM